MGIYSRALKHIDMKRVKKLHEEKVEQKKLVEKEKERIKEELRNLNSPEFSNWRCELEEGMTSSGLFQTTLPATGDTVLTDVPATADAMGSLIGLEVDGEIKFGTVQPGGGQFSSNWYQWATTNSYDTSLLSHLSFRVTSGTGNNAPLPAHPLKIDYYAYDGDGSEYDNSFSFGSIAGSILSSGEYNFELPPDARKKNTFFQFKVDSFDEDDSESYRTDYLSRLAMGRNFWGATVADTASAARIWDIVNASPGTSNSSKSIDVTLLIFYFYNGREYGGFDPFPVSGSTSGHTEADRLYLWDWIRDNFSDLNGAYSKTFTVSNIGLKRRTPITVFVPLDSPEATSFIRSEPNLSNLSPEERRKKLQELLAASDEYIEKILGPNFPGTNVALPGEYDPFAQAPPGQAGDTPGVEIAQWRGSGQGEPGPGFNPSSQHKNQGPFPSDDTNPYKGGDNYKWDPVMKIYAPNIKRVQNSPTGQDTQIAGNVSFPPVEPGHGFRGRYDQFGREIDPKTGKPVLAPMSPPVKKVQKNKNRTMVAHHEPKGNLITERKKKLKSPEEIMNKIPGYYDGKPAPLGFPIEQPPKMVNGMHPDLVDGKKVADRFNRLDPQSAKAMPLTGNPHIDKKVRSARKNPK